MNDKTVADIKANNDVIKRIANERIDEAYDAFWERHGYDLRDGKNNDHLRYTHYSLDKKGLTLYYMEVTPHDQPYGIEITIEF